MYMAIGLGFRQTFEGGANRGRLRRNEDRIAFVFAPDVDVLTAERCENALALHFRKRAAESLDEAIDGATLRTCAFVAADVVEQMSEEPRRFTARRAAEMLTQILDEQLQLVPHHQQLRHATFDVEEALLCDTHDRLSAGVALIGTLQENLDVP